LVSVGVLTRVFPPGLVDEVIAGAGRRERRHRSLPARVMVYFSIGMALHSEGSYEDILGLLSDGLSWVSGGEPVRLPTKSAIFQARDRLGFEPLEALFRRVAVPLAAAGAAGCWLAGRRLVAIDGTCLDVADTAENDERFGRPGVNKGERAAFPQARMVAVAECGTHAVLDAAVGPYGSAENTLAGDLMDRLQPGMLVLADRGFCGYPLWARAAASGADLLWRAKSTMKPRHVETLPDGTWLAELRPGGNPGRTAVPLTVRVIDYTIDDGRPNEETYRLLTTIVDPNDATAEDLALAYRQRWEIESLFDELKTHQRGARTVLRSKSPALVLQEIWGHLCCHYAIRSLMWEAAQHAKVDPDRVSFVAALRIARRSIPAARDFSPSGH
jgi:Insertion element 4 transposase N-terminal/Transposase DDE domain